LSSLLIPSCLLTGSLALVLDSPQRGLCFSTAPKAALSGIMAHPGAFCSGFAPKSKLVPGHLRPQIVHFPLPCFSFLHSQSFRLNGWIHPVFFPLAPFMCFTFPKSPWSATHHRPFFCLPTLFVWGPNTSGIERPGWRASFGAPPPPPTCDFFGSFWRFRRLSIPPSLIFLPSRIRTQPNAIGFGRFSKPA